jgi:hypothetical protein
MSGRDSGITPPRTPRGWRSAACWLALGALLAGCSDEPPSGPAPRPVAPAHPEVPHARPGELLLHRTSSAPEAIGAADGRDARGARRAQRRETFRVAESALDRRAGVVRLRVPDARTLTPERLAELPSVPVLQFPARAASAVCDNAPAWRRESRVGALTVVTRGRGDEPWSTIETWADGQLVARSQTKWERGSGSWRLVSHEDVAVGGATRTFAVDRSGLRDVGEALPRVRCENTSADVVPAVAAASVGTEVGPVGLARLELAARFGAEECTPTDEEAEAACGALLVASIGAAAGATAAAAGMWLACMPPAVVTALPCLQATATFTGTAATAAVAAHAYQECRQKAKAPKPCSCPAQPTTELVAGALTAGTLLPATAPLALDCDPPAPPTGGGNGGEGGGGSPGGGTGRWVEICRYTDYYDGDGRYLYTVDHGCEIVWEQ